MKLHDFNPAPNGQRVRIFMAEKGIDVPIVEVALRDWAQFEEPFLSMNPFSVVPVLELDDGTFIGESVAICRYLEDLHPDPSLMGRDSKERAVIQMWDRRMELDGYLPVMHALRNAIPNFEGRVLPGTRNDLPQHPEITQRGKDALLILLARMDDQLANNRFIAGENFSIADITAHQMIRLAERIEVSIPENLTNVARWFAEVDARPSLLD